MVRPITKHAVQLTDPSQIAYELERAVYIARSGRPGPVVLDLPDDLQRELIVPDHLRHYDPPMRAAAGAVDGDAVDRVLSELASAERPVLILGWGVYLASAAERARALADALQIPVLTSWGAKDMFPDDHPLLVGTFGTHGIRPGNFAVQNTDLVVAIGARLSTHETGTPLTDWARAAKIIVVDVDQGELDKFAAFDKPLEIGICADAGDFINEILSRDIGSVDYRREAWTQCIAVWKRNYPAGPARSWEHDAVDPYAFVSILGAMLPADEQIFIDTGCAIAWMMQAFPVRGKQRLYQDFHNTALGWALPAAIGGCLALDKSTVTCVVGDGSLMMNIQEFATIRRHNLPIRIIVINNNGYSMVKQTQDQWMNGSYAGTSIEGGLGFPNYEKLAASFDVPYVCIERSEIAAERLQQAMDSVGPVIVNVCIPASARVMPQSKFGFPIEDAEPLLARDEFAANMIVAPLPRSMMDMQ